MVIIITLAVLFVLFFMIRKHTGPAHLAMIAGLSVYEMFGGQLASWLQNVPIDNLSNISGLAVYLLLVAGFPLLLYIRSARGGTHGILRLVESALFAALMTSLLVEPLQFFFAFDDLANQIATVVNSMEGIILLVGIISAYLDILFLNPRREY